MKLAIVDVGCGNIGSVSIAFERLGLEMITTADPEAIASADRVVLPGVGAAGYAMRRIDELGLREPIKALKQPVLGICLGMQLLFDRSDEEGADCLGIIPGEVRRLEPTRERPVPHMGWSKLSLHGDVPGLTDGDYVYFAHSYACDPGPHVLASADYGREIPAIVARGNFLGAQFHPERSGPAGTRFLEKFVTGL
ncbi:MAG: Imidazole glycerol phosphate synthase amidotransferase subunit [uncultured Sphingosinicella sp.]|uniref:Imidazole glycerol phosphate synthase subunit HisH n=1 Tax=uncultured Sphingosinicella sp. TaxID=478748 RepID=A0A6J4U3Z4_9SPHN|nr:imidazole glycerol phosphate synthase subunit HisH [uncultured Sphingosinicella sp.]CAA9538660.1 MAG: Imidazole glycerol phosphate synthase amidotransferase subunit [uncultured Sphingosinicella sp.]